MATTPSTRTPAADRPVVRVLPLLGLPQLDRLFDYQVSEADSAAAVRGARVRIRFAGRLVDGIVYDRAVASEHPGRLSYIERVVGVEPVVTEELFELVERVAQRWVGVRSDILRLAIPPRHAAAEKSVPPADDTGTEAPQDPTAPGENAEPDVIQHLPHPWEAYPRAGAFAAAVRAGKAVRGTWTAAPGEDWAQRLAEMALHAAADGRQSVVVVPDQRDLDRVMTAAKRLSPDHGLEAKDLVDLHAGLGPQARYSRWLRILRGHARLVVGTRSAVWAPLRRPGILIVWDDGDDSLAEPRAPYPHTRDVAVLRSQVSGIPLLLGGLVRTPEVAELVEAGWAPEISAADVRRRVPRIVAVTDADPVQARDVAGGHTRLPTVAMTMARQALDRGQPVLVQTPRRGYIPRLTCQSCRTPARCRRCNGPLEIGEADSHGAGVLTCKWCGVKDVSYSCPSCGGRRLRAGAIGNTRTAEELGRMFPNTRVVAVAAGDELSTAPDGPMLVVATPGAEPPAAHGYGAALLLDAWSLLLRPDLRATENALRRWIGAATLVVPHSDGGEVFCSAEAGLPVAQSLIRWDVEGFAHRELAERREVGFPPAAHLFAVDGESADVVAIADAVEEDAADRLGLEAEVLGPVELPEAEPLPGGDAIEQPERMLIRVRRNEVWAVARLLRAAVITRASRREGQPVRVRLDPLHIG